MRRGERGDEKGEMVLKRMEEGGMDLKIMEKCAST